jgi:hypothetical protein
VRIYLPATWTRLSELADSGRLGPAPLTGFAVTPGLREWYVEGTEEELEYAAMSEAANASLRLIDADPAVARRRVVVVAEVPPDGVRVRDELDRGVVELVAEVPIDAISAVHVDDQDAESIVAAAAAAIVAADLGDDAAQDVVDDAGGFELSWYATQELGALVELG